MGSRLRTPNSEYDHWSSAAAASKLVLKSETSGHTDNTVTVREGQRNLNSTYLRAAAYARFDPKSPLSSAGAESPLSPVFFHFGSRDNPRFFVCLFVCLFLFCFVFILLRS